MPENGLGLQNILFPTISGSYPLSYAETPTGTLLLANGVDRMIKWEPLAVSASTAGVQPPDAATELGAVGAGLIAGQYVCFVRFIDRDGNPSDLSPVSNAIDTGTDGFIEAMTVQTGRVLIRSEAHGRATGDPVVITGVVGTGLSLANGTWTITAVDADTFTIPLTVSTSGAFDQGMGGTWTYGVESIVYGAVPVSAEDKVTRRQILRNLSGNADVLYVDIDTDDLLTTAFMSERLDEDLATQEAVPLTYGEDDLPFANRNAPPPDHKSVVTVHQGRAFATGDVIITEGHVEPTFNSPTVQGVGTNWPATLRGRVIYIDGATSAYEIGEVDVENQVITLTFPYFEQPLKFAKYTIRPAPAERRLVYYSEPGNIEAWPAYNALAVPEDSDEITGMFVKGPYLYVIESRHIYRLTFQEDPLDDGFIFLATHRGCINNRCHVTVEGMTYMLDEAGIHSFDGENSEQVSDPVQNIFQVDGTSDFQVDWASDQKLWHAAHDPVRNTIRWFLTLLGEGELRHCISYNYRQKRFWIEGYPTAMTASCVATLGYRRSLAGTEGRRVVVLAEGAYDGVDGTGSLRGVGTSFDSTTINDTTASFAALEGAPVTVVDGLGRRQTRVIAANTATALYLRDPLTITPDPGATYQVGGIPWEWRSGWFRYSDNEAENTRDVELVYEPLTAPTTLDLRVFVDHDSSPVTWDLDSNDDGKIVTRGSPYITFQLDTRRGYTLQRISGHADTYAFGDQYVSIELSGVQSGEPVRIHEVILSGAEK